ncbi:MAG: response regulator transcription factor [Gammaproteobacteria bacterium]|nr:response regulator transcription factor [Gammaproteobacteria bacterium]MBU2059305.1 response regulator transcription factor [Gammaproteobacteria bacterium]MBU2175315.1 response regulator transcription factor [Gammaproteobacteria bacterium]MBU2247523.1 response regulator transcription factor [Gammaproteobacteria bacterium]MBU2342717.1 response regulator transcription factor [Gammaproteobacteria bacterium]
MAFQIVLAEDHPIFLDALASAISEAIPAVQVFKAADYLRLFELLEEHCEQLDMLLMDLSMPGSSGLSGLHFIRSRFKELPIVVLSGHDDLAMRQQCLSAGASAFLSKSADYRDVIKLINQLLHGDYQFQAAPTHAAEVNSAQKLIARLTPGQYKVFQLLAEGYSNKHIANKLGVAEKTVKVHVSAILEKLQVDNRTQAACLMTEAAASWLNKP